MAKTVKVKFGIYISDGGDGSYNPHIVPNVEFAEMCGARGLEEYGQAVEDGGASEVELEVDVETGDIVNGIADMSELFEEDNDGC